MKKKYNCVLLKEIKISQNKRVHLKVTVYGLPTLTSINHKMPARRQKY
jgi:hypothetical protein